jgi:hypothetical protein
LLAAAKKGKFSQHQAVIVEMRVADRGLVVASMESAASLRARLQADVKPAGAPVTLASFAANLDLEDQSGAITREEYPDGFIVSYRVIELGKRGSFWWRHWVTMGVTAMSREEEEMQLLSGDYFAAFDDAKFPDQVATDITDA